uniref:J domain-containing protein n=1 Tax=Ananas comosus var. bracteatus TaxID=296719 RepID=A0A6V7QRU1_ANACO
MGGRRTPPGRGGAAEGDGSGGGGAASEGGEEREEPLPGAAGGGNGVGGEIKAAYRAMAKRVHPDVAAAAEGGGCGGVGGGAGPEEFLEIRRAYETLSDPTARAEYDLSIGRLRFTAAPGFRSRRWETDQCW